MTAIETIAAWPVERIQALYDSIAPADVETALRSRRRTPRDLVALLSPHALPRLEDIAREAHRQTRRQFGRTMGLYAPIYISNLCAADCLYCGFACRSGSREIRTTLSPDEIRAECAALAAEGFQNILLLTGEAPRQASPEYIAEAVAIAREYFASVSVEVYAFDEADYGRLVDNGLEGVTMYMETYHRPLYETVHLQGQKKDYEYRLDALERAGRAGVRKLTVGALLGLYDWRFDIFWTALHARQLETACWTSAVNVSFPRLRHTPERFVLEHPVSDTDLVQMVLALRLFLPEAGFNLSTRETAAFRDRLIPLGITSMSAGSSTKPGGYAVHRDPEERDDGKVRDVLEQFEVEDARSPKEVVAAIRHAGYDPVWKDFDSALAG